VLASALLDNEGLLSNLFSVWERYSVLPFTKKLPSYCGYMLSKLMHA